MRIALVAESFLPEVNGVTNSVVRVCEHLAARGHEALVVAPGTGPTEVCGFPVERVPGVSLPRYRTLPVGIPVRRLDGVVRDFRPDVLYAAAPFVLGAAGIATARRHGVPSIAVYQTDYAAFAARYGARGTGPAVWAWLRRVHNAADRTLAPSTWSLWQLRHHGIAGVERWARGVDTERFHPRWRDEAVRTRLAPGGRRLVGTVGRLAPEKQLHRLAEAAALPGVRVVVAGAGPHAAWLRSHVPQLHLLGALRGEQLSRLVASLDVFVHAGTDETFCQAVQEALASGVPVVAPAAGGPLDLVQDGRTGLLYDPRRSGALGAAVASVLALDEPSRQRVAAAARASVVHRSWQAIGDELLDHCAAVIAGAPRPVARAA